MHWSASPQLYAIEQQIDSRSPEARRATRQDLSAPIVADSALLSDAVRGPVCPLLAGSPDAHVGVPR